MSILLGKSKFNTFCEEKEIPEEGEHTADDFADYCKLFYNMQPYLLFYDELEAAFCHWNLYGKGNKND